MLPVLVVLLVGSCYGQLNQGLFDNGALELFTAADINKDGIVTLSEMQTEFNTLDTNGNGVESRHEFTEFICASAPDMYNLAHYLFDEFDLDKNHHLDVHDYEYFFNKVDVNKDGQATESEFNAFTIVIFLKYNFAGQHSQHSLHGPSACH